MALANVLTLSQITTHIVGLVLGFCVLIPMLIHLSQFNGYCMLFADGFWGEDDGLFHIRYTNQGFCTFPIFTSMFLILVCTVQIYRFTRLSYRKEETTFLGLFLDVVFSTIMLLFTIISAFFITCGFIAWCSDMTQRFPSCDRAAGQNITKEELHINTTGFYLEMGTAQFGIWGAFAASVLVSVVAYLKLINDHQLYTMKVSMYLERQRLVHGESNKDLTPDSPSTSVANPPIEVSPPESPNNC